MKPGWLLTTLRTALAEMASADHHSQPLFPTLPLLEATEFGQQHVITTFCLGTPPPLLVMPTGSALPAVTLHLIWPQGYTFWQPETGTRQYLGGVRTTGELPAAYQLLLRSYSTQQPALSASAAHNQAAVAAYLLLLEEVLAQQWLAPHHPITLAEKATAKQLGQALTQLGEPAHQAYYQSRGKALFAWMARATYEPSWAEAAEGAALAAPPAWLDVTEAVVVFAPPFVAVLGGRPCLVVASYRQLAGPPSAGQLVAACYISYPEQEVRWRQFDSVPYLANALLIPPLPKLAEMGTPAVSSDPAPTTQRYLQLLSLVLARAWLVNRHPVTAEEAAVATELRSYVTTLLPPALHAYYQREAWQMLGWLARTVG